MNENKSTVIALVIPSLSMGGMERVIVLLANYFADQMNKNVHLIKLGKGENNYTISQNVILHEPNFYLSSQGFVLYSVKIYIFLRKILHRVKPEVALSFGDRYNGFIILATLGLKTKVFVSNRMNPRLSNGFFIDLLNWLLYPYAEGIIAQTKLAREVFKKRYRHKNIAVIGNPFFIKKGASNQQREKIILNVGRFTNTKNQNVLVRYFNELNQKNWRLLFLGDGDKKEVVQKEVSRLSIRHQIEFVGNTPDVYSYYQQAKIFAFTSTTEGFPNALGEAMAAGCACISFDCETGPSDLIDDGINGFLVKNMDHETYKRKLLILMENDELRGEFGKNAQEKMKQFSMDKIGKRYLEFILN